MLLLLLTFSAGACREEGPRGAVDSPSGPSEPLFALLPSSRTGVTFRNDLPETPARNGLSYQYYYNGGGVAVGDLNGDDLPDLYFTANMGPNRLYLNRGGLSFEDVTERAGVAGPGGGWATGVTFVDIDADGRLDIYVSQSGPFGDEDLRRNLLFVNRTGDDGVPTFTEEASVYGLDDPGFSTQGAFFDADGDGELDLYLMNHGIPAYRSLVQLQEERSPYETDRLYRNDGGRFVDVSSEAGLIDTNLGFGLGLSVGDVNNDGRPDLYVANDYSGRDYLYLGEPDGRFREELERSMGHIPYASMGSDIADMDGDGWLDLAVLEMDLPTHYGRKTSEMGTERERFAYLAREGLHYQYMANALQWNRGSPDGRLPVFSDIAHLTGVARTDWSWAPLFADLDNDGRPDLFVSNGMAGQSINPDFDEYMRRRIAEVQAAEGRTTEALIVELIDRMPRRRVPNHVYRNLGDLTFTNRAADWGLDQAAYSTGAVYSDLDRDGDLDLVVNNVLEEAFVYRNDRRERGGAHFLAVQLQGPQGNPFGIGARVRLVIGDAQQTQEMHLTRGYQSSVEPRLHFGLGEDTGVDTVEVRWPDGSMETRAGVAADRVLTLEHADGSPADGAGVAPPPLFRHAQDELRPIPRHHASVSVLDPSLEPYPSKRDEVVFAVGDLDGDGLDDFVFGGSGEGPSRIYLQEEDGSFPAASELPSSGSRGRTAAAAIFDADGDGDKDIWLVVEFEVSATRSVHRHRLLLNTGAGRFRDSGEVLAEQVVAGTTLAPGDFDGDGQSDLFVGHRTVPGADPAPGSLLLRGDGGGFRDVTTEVAPALSGLRTVTDAVWADMDGSGEADLLVAGEWMPVSVFLNDGGLLEDATGSAGLDRLTGWWQSLTVADFDGDGDPDVVAGNVGLNYPYHPTPERPLELYVDDFDRYRGDEAVLAYHEGGERYPWLGRERLSEILPWVPELYPTLDAFARATLPDILGGEDMRGADRFEVGTLATTYLENVGDGRLRPRPLPRASQLSVVFGAVPADFDGDGALDLVLAGNLHALDPSVPRLDGGVGLFLRGDGGGRFQAVPPSESGLWLGGPVRRLERLSVGSARVPALLAGVAGGDALHVRPFR